MRHNKNFNHLGRQAGHRKAMLSNMASSLILHKRIETTLAKAKAVRMFVEPLVTKSKEDTTHSRRVVFSSRKQKEAVKETPELVNMLKKYHPIWLNTHFNHPNEITEESAAACARLADAGIPLGNQTVLLRGINDCTYVMKKLMHGLVKMRVRPYYIYQCDLSMGIEHFRTPVSKGIEIMENLRGHTSGYAVPTFVVDAPGGGGKTPVMPNYVISQSPNRVVLRNYEGVITTYTEPTDYKEECHCPECEQARKEGVAALLHGDMLSIEPKHLARNERNHHE